MTTTTSTTSRQSTVIESSAVTFFNLICEGLFTVPWHQRRYDWKPDHVDELLQDIDDAVNAKRPCYFLGTVILVRSGPKRWRINDGQQRLVTLSLICACLRRRFTEQSDSLREHLALRVLFDIAENSSRAVENIDRLTPRVTSPRDDKTRYGLMIRGRNIGANGKLTQAWRQIDAFVHGMGAKKAACFFDFLTQKLEVARLSIPDYVDPNSVYETINCRGKRLEDLDLIRNHLYSYFNADDDATRRDIVHENLESIRVRLRDTSRFADYARCYFQSRYGFLQKSSFYRDTKRHLQSRANQGENPSDYVFRLVEDFSCHDKTELFRAISTPNKSDRFVKDFASASGHADGKRSIAMFLRELHGYKVTQPLLFALLWHYVRETDVRRKKRLARSVHARLKHIASFVMRTAFVAPKFEPSHFESEFSSLAEQVMSSDRLDRVDVDGGLRECDSTYGVIDNKKFKARMRDLEMRDTKKIKRLLIGVNCLDQSDADILNESHCTVEHILPKAQRHWPTWHSFSSVDPEDWVHRLGNLTLLGRQDNRPGESDNRDFETKKPTYLRSAIHITREVGGCGVWSPQEILGRQRRIAIRAARVWSFESSMKP